jgi:hypothetical protein
VFTTIKDPAARSRVHAPVPADGGDITALLNAWLPNVPAGSTVTFPPNKTYTVSSPGIKCLTMQPGVSFDWNGCTLAVPAAFFHVATQHVVDLAVTLVEVATTATMTKGQTTFTIPAGVVPALGDLVTFTSSTLASSVYEYRWTTRVVKVAGQAITVDTGAPAAVTLVKVGLVAQLGRTGGSTFEGLRIDMTACPTLATPIQFQVIGLQMQGYDRLHLTNCQFVGAPSACVAFALFASMAPKVSRCSVANFHALPMFQTGRLGYGFQFNDVDQAHIVDCEGFGCRHAIAQGGFTAGAITVENCTFSADPARTADMIPAAGVLVDSHDGHRGTLIVQNCTFQADVAAAYARGASMVFRNNKVKLIDPGAQVVRPANEFSHGTILIESNEVTGATDTNRLMSTVTYSTSILAIRRNTMDGGALLSLGNNLPNTASFGLIEVSDNIHTNAYKGVEVQFTGAPGFQVDRLIIRGNRITMAPTGAAGIFIRGLVANTLIGHVEVEGNIIDVNATAATIALDMRQFLAQRILVNDNTFYGGSATHGGGGLTWQMDSTPATDGIELRGNRCDADVRLYSAAVHPMPRLSVNSNRIRRMFVEENNAASPFGTGQWDFSHNRFGDQGYIGQGLEFRASSTTFWSDAKSSIIVTDNQFETTGSNAVVVNAGHTGNRIVFRGNVMGAANIADATNTNYSTSGNYTTGSQNGRGSTSARPDGLYDFNAPTSGTWVIGDRVWRTNPSNSAGVNIGWTCVVAGTPGTWRAFGNTV